MRSNLIWNALRQPNCYTAQPTAAVSVFSIRYTLALVIAWASQRRRCAECAVKGLCLQLPIAAEVVERAIQFIQRLEEATQATDLVRLFATPSLIR